MHYTINMPTAYSGLTERQTISSAIQSPAMLTHREPYLQTPMTFCTIYMPTVIRALIRRSE